ncbi:protein bottleneck [Drosophila miranda]|uniref:protein bottleneck n=1 Tax=Drosophila miranda TaxID=7229 RepID=UPI0007E86607|nr:protein bottleneck [Drosophila miranda]
MSISTFNFQFYNYKIPAAMGCSTSRSSSSFISELEMDIDEEMSSPAVTSTPRPRFTTELALQLQRESPQTPAKTTLHGLRPQLHTPQKRWSMELREKVLEMSKRNNGSDGEEQQPQTTQQEQQQQQQQKQLQQEQEKSEQHNGDPNVAPTVTDKINFFNKLTNTFESTRSGATATGTGTANSSKCNNNNRFISLLRSTRPQGIATTSSSNNSSLSGTSVLSQVPPPKPKRLMATAPPGSTFAMPSSMGMGGSQRKSSLRRKPSMDKSRATISRQNSSASVRPQHHAIMEDLSLVVPVRLRIAEYEQRISMSA